MVDLDTLAAIHRLRKEGHSTRAIATSLGIARSTVRACLARPPASAAARERTSTLDPHLDRVRALFLSCRGNRVRVHEELVREGIDVASYWSLTRFCVAHGIGVEQKPAVGTWSFAPGEEMQHDTSPHKVEVGGKRRLLQCASLVLCYSRLRFCQVYPSFDRFACKVFLTAALRFFGGAARRCMIDNTHVVLAGGSGKNAIIAPEMEAFARRFGFGWEAHAPGWAERSARVERSFHEVENNFYPGRTFESVADCNAQLRAWCEQKNAVVRRHLQASPLQLFAAEQPALVPLPLHVPDVVEVLRRAADRSAEIRVETNRYSVPDALANTELEVLLSHDRVRVVHRHAVVADHARAEAGKQVTVRDPSHRRVRRKELARRPLREERVLATGGEAFAAMVALLQAKKGAHATRAIKRLHAMFLDYPTPVLAAVLAEAVAHGLYDLERVDKMVVRRLGTEFFRLPTPQHDEDTPDGE